MAHKLKRLNIEVSALCNLDCVGCPNTYMTRQKGYMSFELFFNIFQEVRDRLDRAFLWNYGEPLLNPQIDRMIEAVRDFSVVKVLSTNGHMLETFDDLSFLTDLDELIISLNGITPDVYNKHQHGGDFATVCRGLSALKPYMVRADTTYVLQMVANRHNLNQIDLLDSFAHEFGFDKVLIKSFNVMDDKEETMQEFVPLGTPFSRYTPKGKVTRGNPTRSEPCLEWMVINWNGEVNTCCWDYEGRCIMGNVSQEGVFGVWESEKMQKHRLRIESGKYLPFCLDCTNGKTIKEWEVNK